jgi:hypothetical protein
VQNDLFILTKSVMLGMLLSLGIVDLTGGKCLYGCWSWNEADCLDVLVVSLASQWVSSLMVAVAGMKLTVLMSLWHPWLDRR